MQRYVIVLVFPGIKRKSGKTCPATQRHIPNTLTLKKVFLYSRTSGRLRKPISLLINGCRELFSERKNGRGLRLTTDLDLVSSLIMCGTTTSLSLTSSTRSPCIFLLPWLAVCGSWNFLRNTWVLRRITVCTICLWIYFYLKCNI
jgi:hypothetical protein